MRFLRPPVLILLVLFWPGLLQAKASCSDDTRPDLSNPWPSQWGTIHWKEGWYGSEQKTISGALDCNPSTGIWEYNGTWTHRSTGRSGPVRLIFETPYAFTGEYKTPEKSVGGWTGSASGGKRASDERKQLEPEAVAGCPYPQQIAKIEKDTRDAINKLLRPLRRHIDSFEKGTRPKLCIENGEGRLHIQGGSIFRSVAEFISKNTETYFVGAPLLQKVEGKLMNWMNREILKTKDLVKPPEEAWREFNDLETMRRDVINNMETVLRRNMCKVLPAYEEARNMLGVITADEVLANPRCNRFQRNDAVYKARLIREQLKREFEDMLPEGGRFDSFRLDCL